MIIVLLDFCMESKVWYFLLDLLDKLSSRLYLRCYLFDGGVRCSCHFNAMYSFMLFVLFVFLVI